MNNYEILEISQNASIPEIKKAFRKKAKKCHPDKGGDINTFIQLKEAYENIMKGEKGKIQLNNVDIMTDILNHHYLLKRFFTLFNSMDSDNKHYWIA